jgi:tetratricopeptide (TPR) repeat protein
LENESLNALSTISRDDLRAERFFDTYAPLVREVDTASTVFQRSRRSARKTLPNDVGSILRLVKEKLDFAAEAAGEEGIGAAEEVVELLRSGHLAARDPGLAHNLTGLALTTLAEQKNDIAGFEEARREFESARKEWEKQSTTHSAWLRASINLAVVLWQLGDRLSAPALVEDAVGILTGILPEMPPSSLPDGPRAQDTLGNALMSLGRADEAITAYQNTLAALAILPESNTIAERGHSLNNLGTAYTAKRLYDKAINAYEQALILQRAPRARARTQHNLGEALWQQGYVLGENNLEEARKYWEAAAQVFEAALEVRAREWAPRDWAVTAVGLANVLTNSSELAIAAPPSKADKEAGLGTLSKAVGLYEAAIPNLNRSDRARACRNLMAALRSVVRYADSIKPVALAIVSLLDLENWTESAPISIPRINRTDAKSDYMQQSQTLMDEIAEEIRTASRKILYLPLTNTIPDYMPDKDEIIRRIRSELEAAGIPQSEWATVLQEVGGRPGPLSEGYTNPISPEGRPDPTPTDLKLSASQINALLKDSTLGRLHKRYLEAIENICLPPVGFSSKEEAQGAGRLSTTYQNLVKRLTELGVDSIPKDSRVTEAERLRAAFYRRESGQRATPKRRVKGPAPE